MTPTHVEFVAELRIKAKFRVPLKRYVVPTEECILKAEKHNLAMLDEEFFKNNCAIYIERAGYITDLRLTEIPDGKEAADNVR